MRCAFAFLLSAALFGLPVSFAVAQQHDHHATPSKSDGKKAAKKTKPVAKKGGSATMSTGPAPKTGSMPKGGPTPTGKLGTEPTAKGKLGTDPQPGDPQSKPPRPQ